MSTNNLHIKFLLLVAVLSIFCTLAAQAQTGFREPTVNTILPRFAMKSLASGEPTDTLTGWRLGGEGELMFRDDTLCHFYEDTWLTSPELDAAMYDDMELWMEMSAISTSKVRNYTVVVECDGKETKVPATEEINLQRDSCSTYILPLPKIENGVFRIKIKGIGTKGQSISRAQLASLSLHGKYLFPTLTPQPANTSFSIPMPEGYDRCRVDVMKAERNAYATDTLAYFGFQGGDYTGAETNATNFQTGVDYFHGMIRNEPTVFSFPLVVMGINDSVYVNFKEKKTTHQTSMHTI